MPPGSKAFALFRLSSPSRCSVSRARQSVDLVLNKMGGCPVYVSVTVNPNPLNPMKRAFTILALAAAFSLTVPTASEAAPGKSKHKTSSVSKHRPSTSTRVASVRSGSRSRGHVVVASSHHHSRGVVRSSPYRHAYTPRVAVRPPAYCYVPRRPLLSILFGF